MQKGMISHATNVAASVTSSSSSTTHRPNKT